MLVCVALMMLARLATLHADSEFLVLHHGNIFSNFEELDKYGNVCEEPGSSNCYGGIARVAAIVKEAREKAFKDDYEVLFFITGNFWKYQNYLRLEPNHSLFRILNYLKPDFMALGAEELKGGIDPIRSLLKATNFPILASNINEPHRLPTLRESYTFYRSGQNFTIIGYAPPQSSNNSTILAADIEYSDDLTTICDLTKRLQKTELKNVYVVGDSGYDRNKQIAEKCQFVDMLITGKNNTESNDTQSQYPEIIRNEPSETHKQTPILYISSPDKYLGYLYVHVTTWYDFVEYWDGKPRLLDHMIAPDPKMMQLVQQFKQQSSQQRSEYILARTKVHLEGRESICRTKDCNLGALLADSLVHCRANLHQGPLWTDTPIAIIYGGILQGSLVPRPNKTEIRYRDVDKVLPYNRRLVKLSLTGLQIYQVIGSAIQEGSGHFVQVSGLNIGFKVVQGKRIVTSATALCNNCTRLVYKQVYFHRQYGVITTESFVNGEEGFDFRLSNLSKKLSIFDKECFSNYIHSLGWICPKDTPRIQLESNSNVVNPFRVLFCFLCLVIH